jgi:2-keto-4-pentenoate hydratase/2-oxohepta-3-ene-1,7-dioic acid hydratase in catechol pathway
MKIICIGRNYAEHAAELGNPIPQEPVIFMKPKSALINLNAPYYYPEFTNCLHYECELVLRICKNGTHVSQWQAAEFYNAITVGIDFTARDIQDDLKKKGLPWEKSKSFDGSAAVGKFIDINLITDKSNIAFSLKKNGEIVQRGISHEMLFGFGSIIENVSKYFTLNIGDLIFTGTPAGVGECMVNDNLEGFIEDESLFKLRIK